MVFEARPYWQPELQRRFVDENVEVSGCRSLRDLDKRLRRERTDVVVLDLAADVGGSLRWLARHDERYGPVPVIVVAGDEQLSLEWSVREQGATAFVSEFIGGRRMAAVCRKAWNRSSEHTWITRR